MCLESELLLSIKSHSLFCFVFIMGCGASTAAAAVQAANKDTPVLLHGKSLRVPSLLFDAISSRNPDVHTLYVSDKVSSLSTKKASDDSSKDSSPVLPNSKQSKKRTSLTQLAAAENRLEWAVRPGYSSGASSYEGSVDGDALSDSELIEQRRLSELEPSRQSDMCALGNLRQSMMDRGSLTEAVVRIETLFGKPIEEIYEGVHDGPVLGSGVSGIVRLIKHRATGTKYAVKVLDLGKPRRKRQAERTFCRINRNSQYHILLAGLVDSVSNGPSPFVP